MLTLYWVLAGLAVLAAIVTGWWRVVLRPLTLRRMTVASLDLRVAPDDAGRIDAILAGFAGGFNAMLTSPRWSGWERFCAGQPSLWRPFAQEGAAMGYMPRRSFRFDAADFERRVVAAHPGGCYLHYVGLGFWFGMRGYSQQRIEREIARLDPVLRMLCYDGYGFKVAFFDAAGDPAKLSALDRFEGYARNAACQGAGRALFFRNVNDPERLHDAVASLGDYAPDAAGGVGLASVFIFPDRLEVAIRAGLYMPEDWRADAHLGMCFGLKARSISDAEQFTRDIGRMDEPVRASIGDALAVCDEVEASWRERRAVDGYQRWREQVRAWMRENLVFPLGSRGSEDVATVATECAATVVGR